MSIVFEAFPKIGRLRKPAILTEKLDGTNAAIVVTDQGDVYCQSRTQIITPEKDNAGFANWVYKNREELARQLGPGIHFGEWWGAGIGRGYGLKEKRFSLFNTHVWHTESEDCRCVEAPLCYVVPTLAVIEVFSTEEVEAVMAKLKETGSVAAKGYPNPEGIVVFHTSNQTMFKITYEHDRGKWAE